MHRFFQQVRARSSTFYAASTTVASESWSPCSMLVCGMGLGAITSTIVYAEEETLVKKKKMNGLKIFSGNANQDLAKRVAELVGVPLGALTVDRFADGEVNVMVHENVRGNRLVINIQMSNNEHNFIRQGCIHHSTYMCPSE